MGKKKISSSVQERRKKRSTAIPLVSRNRFEIHINKAKHNILGKKEKNDRGLPGISRSKANKKRKETLLVNYKQRNKSNVMIDKRFGEFDETVSVEEKMLKRFALEKQSHHVKTGHYNLADDEELTHYGQSIGEMTNFDEIELGSSDDDGDGGIGGFLTKKNMTEEMHDKEPRNLTRKEIMNEIIADSKRDKHERQKTKELAFELTQRLDTEWKQIHSLLTKKRTDSEKDTFKEKQDDYDRIVNELIFEAKGKPTERLKSVEEIARIEKQKQAKMEKERKDRMEMLDDDEDESIHQSADALIEKLPKKTDDRYMLQYRDGQMVKPEGFDDSLNPPDAASNEDVGEENGGSSKDNDSDSGDDSNDDDSDEEDADGDDDSDEDVFSDEESVLKSEAVPDTAENCCVDDTMELKNKEEITKLETELVLQNNDNSKTETCDVENNNVKSKKSKKKQNGLDESVLLSEIPESLENLLTMLEKSKSDVSLIIPKLRQINVMNKGKLEKLVDISFKYIDYACENPESHLLHLNKLGSVIQQLSEDIPVYVTKAIQSKLRIILNRISYCAKKKKYSEMMLSLSELFLFKVVELIYPTSDLNHMITTPCMVIIALIFTKAQFSDMKNILAGVFLLDVVYSYVKLSKRYFPELVTILVKLFYEAVPSSVSLAKITSSILNMEKKYIGLLYLKDKQHSEPSRIKLSVLTSSYEPAFLENDSSRLSIIRNLLIVTDRFLNLYKELETFKEIFEPVVSVLEVLPVDNYTTSMIDIHEKLITVMQSASLNKKEPLKLQARKPIPLTLLEPQFEEVNDNLFKKRGGNKAKNEHDKLKYKVKKEMKGAVREIRKDTQYLAKQQLSEQLEKDATRKRKVKELKSALENEGREIKEMEKGSKVKK